jgi:GntR family transcriptional regulator, transcriptional repressor for pyruvate dehydrogenase complex
MAAARRGRKPKTPVVSELAEGLFETQRPGGLHERVYRSLMHAIATGKFERGSRLPSEMELASTYSVSRPVVRQALVRLREEGAIQSLRGSGNYVASLGDLLAEKVLPAYASQSIMQRLLDDLEFRMVIEPEAAYLAARRRSSAELARTETALRRFEEAHANGAVTHHLDYLFHEAIAIASGNPRFVEAVRALEYSSDDERILMRHLVHFQPSARGAKIIAEHAEVLGLIRKREAGAARAAMKIHISSARLRLIKSLRLCAPAEG